MMKISKIMAILIVGTMILSGCQGKAVATDQSQDANAKPVKIGLNQFAEHSAFEQVKAGFIEELDKSGINYEIDYQNSQGDAMMASSIASKFASDEMDLVFAIGTVAAQAAKQNIGDIPLLFGAVTDPVGSGLVDSWESPGGNVTGTSNKMPIKDQLAMLLDLDSTIKKVGIIYNPSESNSVVQVEVSEQSGAELGLEIVTVGVNTVNDVPQAVDSILGKVDALYTITDNTAASAMGVISQKAIEQNKIVVASTDTFVEEGNLITLGLSYVDLGKQTAQMAIKIINKEKQPNEIPVEGLREIIKVANKETIKALGLDPSLEVFKGAKLVG